MSSAGPDELLSYYHGELEYVRNAGREFARMHPEAARRLELGGMESPDPHVERLIEAFAFIAGRIRRELDTEFPQIASALLEALLPGFAAPIPSMTVVRLLLDPTKSVPTDGSALARGTPLHAGGRRERDGAEVACQFRTCAPATLWPLDVSAALLEDARHHPNLGAGPHVAKVLRLRLTCSGATLLGAGAATIAPASLRFHLHGDWGQIGPLYELLLCDVRELQLVAVGAKAEAPGRSRLAWSEAGYTDDEAVLPASSQAHPAYRLMQEFFAFPRKFLFFDAANLADSLRALGGAKGVAAVDLLLLLGRAPDPQWRPAADQFLLGCTTAINLFPRTSETLRVDQRSVEYRLNPDQRHESSTEIHSILAVDASHADGQPGQPLAPYFGFGRIGADPEGAQWIARRDHAISERMGGSDVFLSFVDLDLRPGAPHAPLVSALTLCTNRHLAESIRPDPPGGPGTFQAVGALGVLPAACLYPPTRQVSAPLDGRQLWRLASLLKLNQISLDQLADQPESERLGAQQQLFELCNTAGSQAGSRLVQSLQRFDCASVVLPVRGGPAPGFRRGFEVALGFGTPDCTDGSPLMLAAVLRRFLPLYTSVNGLVGVSVWRGEQLLKSWPPEAGPA